MFGDEPTIRDLGFNCAGLSVFGEIAELSEADGSTVIDICLKGVLLSVKHEARAMTAGGGGAIVNIASLNNTCRCTAAPPTRAPRPGWRC